MFVIIQNHKPNSVHTKHNVTKNVTINFIKRGWENMYAHLVLSVVSKEQKDEKESVSK